MSPMTILRWPGARCPGQLVACRRGGVPGVVPEGCTGVVQDRWVREGYTGTQARLIPGPIFSHILALERPYGQMKAILSVL